MEENIFEKIRDGQSPATIVFKNDYCCLKFFNIVVECESALPSFLFYAHDMQLKSTSHTLNEVKGFWWVV